MILGDTHQSNIFMNRYSIHFMYLSVKLNVFLLDMNDHLTSTGHWHTNNLFTFSRMRSEKMTNFEAGLTHIETKWSIRSKVKEKLTVFNCMQALDTHILKMLQLIQIYRTMVVFKYMTFKRFKAGLVRRSNSNKSQLRYMYYVQGKIKVRETLKREFVEVISYHVVQYHREECPVTICSKGMENVFGILPAPSRGIWSNNSYGWSCQQCPINHFQPNDKNLYKTCSPCPKYELSTQKRNSCYDPYFTVHLRLQDDKGLMVCFALCTIGFVYIVIAIIIFIRKKDTVIIRGSNFPIMMIHSVLMLLLFLVIPISFTIFRKTTKMTCLMELMVSSILVFSPHTLIFIKCQNLLTAFNSKLRLTGKQKRKSLVSQIVIVLILISFDVFALFLSIHQTPIV